MHQIFTVTVDNAGSNNVVITELSMQLTKWGTNLMGGSHLHIRCMAHIVNLIVQDGTKEANVLLNELGKHGDTSGNLLLGEKNFKNVVKMKILRKSLYA